MRRGVTVLLGSESGVIKEGRVSTSSGKCQSTGIPGLRGTEHVGFTVPDLAQATDFFVNVIGCQYMFELGPFQAADDWMEKHLNVDPRTVMRRLRFFAASTGRISRYLSTKLPIRT
jgi:hypothetical protein